MLPPQGRQDTTISCLVLSRALKSPQFIPILKLIGKYSLQMRGVRWDGGRGWGRSPPPTTTRPTERQTLVNLGRRRGTLPICEYVNYS
ncbi:hypothetical protein COCOBI_pt-1940 (chloroplast) [Coccomyxa sp. Obi]|nr:hypothetical protein COCOBI_pt-1940 [Coccomyxa sp. Obi]